MESRAGVKPGLAVEYAGDRKLRERNTIPYRLYHWPIWIFVFYVAAGPVTFKLFSGQIDRTLGIWLAIVLVVTGSCVYFGQLPGCEPRPYIIRFTEDKANPLYRRVCYTLAWNNMITFATLNLAGILIAIATGEWIMPEVYRIGYFPLMAAVLLAGAIGLLPRAGKKTGNEGYERRYFYGSLWPVAIAQACLGVLWKIIPLDPVSTWIKLFVFVGLLGIFGWLSSRGRLLRTRPIVPGHGQTIMQAD